MTAAFASGLPSGAMRCSLCPHGCVLAPGESGLCGARTNREGGLSAQSYGHVTALALDPIEKKPLRRFRPGSRILSIGSYGCNLRCAFCQNHEISTWKSPGRSMTPGQVAQAALELERKGNIGVAYTYNEPLIGYEFVLDCAKLVATKGQVNVLVTNGYINREPLLELLPLVDALNIDLKCFSERGYKTLGGSLQPVLSTIELAAAQCHVEVTTLIVPGLSDSPEDMQAQARWLAGIDRRIPLHITRFFPRHLMAGAQPTPVITIKELCKIAAQHLDYVYPGNC